MQMISPADQVTEAARACGYSVYLFGVCQDGMVVIRANTVTIGQQHEAKRRLHAAGYSWGKWRSVKNKIIRGWKKSLDA
jgi:hypothetical protein